MATETGGKRQTPLSFYTGDRQLARRVQEHLDGFPPGRYVDPVSVADSLQQMYREYGRRKRLAFRKSVQRVCDWLAKQKSKEDNLDSFEKRHLTKRRKQDTSNGKDWAVADEASSDSFSSDLDDYAMSKDTNLVNQALSNLYSKGKLPSASSSPGHTLKPQAGSNSGTPKATPGGPADRRDEEDFDDENMELGNLAMDLPGDEDEDEEPSRQRWGEMLLPRTPGKETATPAPSGSSTPQPGPRRPKGKKSLPSRQTLTEEESFAKKGRAGPDRGRKGKKKIVEPQQSTTTFSDIGGNDETLHELCKLLIHMRHPEVYQTLGLTPPRGVLLHGPPGCGKTLIAHAVAGELELPFLKIAATEIVSGVSGESEGNIRELFEEAMALAPCILFLDEIDAITPKRETAQREMERRIVAQLLSCMDELNSSPLHVLVIGATNRADSLDPALRRAGRFDREICVGIPGLKQRTGILQVLCRTLRLSSEFSFARLATLTPGYVGADLMSLCREAAMCAVNRIFHSIHRLPSEKALPIVDTPPLQPVNESGGDGHASVVPTQRVEIIGEMEVSGTVNVLPSYQLVLDWLKDHPPLTEEQLQELFIEMKDFEEALPHVQPSAKREGFATIPDVTWADIGALHSIREELSMAIMAPVRNPEAFKSLGLTNPPGILLAGPPGCGKTMLAKAIANESGINFISVKGPELMNMYVGESERAVRQCFQRARNSAPCVIFFDELDALCPKRSDSAESGSSARVVNQLLTEMDGLETRKQVFIVGATNRPDIIDPAVLRPGRLDKTLYVGIPSSPDRVAILQTITKKGTRPLLDSDVNLTAIAEDDRCDGFTGADLSALVREASMAALRIVLRAVPSDTDQRGVLPVKDGGEAPIVVTVANFESAFGKVKASVARKDRDRYRKLRQSTLDLSTVDGESKDSVAT